MSYSKKSASDPGYEIGIDPKTAFSVFYDDGKGKLFFSIEVDGDPKKIYLNPHPSQDGQMVHVRDNATKTRLNLAVERLNAYFEAQGLSVEVD